MKIKKALLITTIGLFMSLVLLIGTSYAWFQDNISSKNNTISSGILDVMLTHDDNGVETEVTETTVLFDDIANGKWEPGVMAVERFTIKNNGNLALIYDITLNISNAMKNAEGKTLADVLKIAYTTEVVANRTDALALTYMSLEDFIISGSFDDNNTEDKVYTVVIYWEPSENDGWFQDGTNIAYTIDLGINLSATQKSSENDSFGNDYDVEAGFVKVTNEQQLLLMLSAGRSVILLNDITLTEGTKIPDGDDVIINMNGKTITIDDNTSSSYIFYNQLGATLKITGDGTFDIGSSKSILFVPFGDLIIENGTFIKDYIRGNDSDPEHAQSIGGFFGGINIGTPTADRYARVTIYDGYFDGGYYRTDDIVTYDYYSHSGMETLLNLSVGEEFTIYGGTFVTYNPAWGDECGAAYYDNDPYGTGSENKTLPSTGKPVGSSPQQGTFLKGQGINDTELPDEYSIIKGTTTDGTNRPTYTIVYDGE